MQILHLLDRKLNEISGGERTKVALCKILVESPDILCLDEPTNFIDMLNIWNTDACRQNKEYFDYLKNDAERILPFFDFKKGIVQTKFFY